MKPVIFYVGEGFWVCERNKLGSIGISPRAAYSAWLKFCKPYER